MSGRVDRQGTKGPWLGGLPPKQKAEGQVGDSLLEKDHIHCRWMCGEDLRSGGLAHILSSLSQRLKIDVNRIKGYAQSGNQLYRSSSTPRHGFL